MIELRILGRIAFDGPDGAGFAALLRKPKRIALLAYLASPSPGTWHRRDFILALFWPDLDMAHARTSLRTAIYELRQSLGDSVIRNRGDEEISIDPEMLETDLAVVLSALKAGDVERALTSYGGDLLPGLFPPDSEGFERWLDSERTRLRIAISTSAMAHVDALEKANELAHALATARKVNDINPDDETIVRRVMTLHDKVGDRAGGLSVFETYRSRLKRDFDADPARETIEVANRLRSSTSAYRAASAVAPDPPPREAYTLSTHHADPIAQPVAASTHSTRNVAPIIAGVLLVATAVVATIAWNLTRGDSTPTIGLVTPLTTAEGLQVETDISPNGHWVAYARGTPSRLRIFVQRINGGAATPLTSDTTQVELMPRWSPDNDEVMFLAGNNAYAAPYLGGKPRLIVRGSDGDGMIRSAAWSPTGDSVVIVRNDSLLVMPSRGGTMRLVGKGFQLHSCVWAHDSRWIACVSGNWIAFTPGPLFGNAAPSTIVLYPVAGGNAVTVTKPDFESTSPAWSPDGRFLWMLSDSNGTAGEVYAGRIGGDGHVVGSYRSFGINAESISLSADRIGYSVATKKANLWSLPIPVTGMTSITSARQLTSGSQVIEVMSVSHDAKWVAFDSNRSGNPDIYSMPVDGGDPEQITSNPRKEFAPDISPDGTEITWQRWVGGVRHLFVKKIESASEEEIVPDTNDKGTPKWSPDGRSIAAWSHNNERGTVFVVRRGSDGKWKTLWKLPFGQLPQWSPDGREIAFVMLDGSVRIIPADSGAIRTLYAPRPNSMDPFATYLSWKKPGSIWVLGNSGASQGIWELSLTTGQLRQVAVVDDPAGKMIGPSFVATRDHFFFALNDRTSNVKWAELNH